jgi:hypothetical protein
MHRICRFPIAVLAFLMFAPAVFAQQVITCASNDMHRNYCSMGRYNNAILMNQRSGSPCVRNQTWGIRGHNIWVDRGCRADFQLTMGGYPGGPGGPGARTTIRCESGNMNYVQCPVPGRIQNAQVARQYSNSPCVQGRSWGINKHGIWVNRGCRADFNVWLR